MLQKTKSPTIFPETAALLDLDAMPATILNETTDIRAEARLAQITATNPNLPSMPRKYRLTNKQLALRLAAIPALAAAFIAGSVLAPTDSPIAPAPANAFASWTAVPAPLIGDSLEAATNACRTEIEWIQSGPGPFPPASSFKLQLPANPTVAEQRGAWAFVQYDISYLTNAAIPMDMANCLIIFENEAPKVVTWASSSQRPDGSGAGSQSIGLGEFGFFQPQQTLAEVALTGSFLMWEMGEVPDGMAFVNYALEGVFQDNGEFSVLSGRVGADVVGAVFHTTTGLEVTATISDGSFAAWWPQYLGIETPQATDNHWNRDARFALAELAYSVTLTLADGTVLPNQDIRTNTLRMGGTL